MNKLLFVQHRTLMLSGIHHTGFDMDNNVKKGEKEEREIPSSLEKLRIAIESDEVPKIYANGIVFIQSNADVGLLLDQLGKPVAVVYMSNILAKTLVKQLGASLLQVEEALEHEFPTTEELDVARAKLRDENK